MVAFWILAPIMVAAAIGILFARKAVHAAMLLAVVMVSLAILYLVQDAPFLFTVQIIVYTGAILMLFLFVLMLVGVDASDSVVETIKGQRTMATVVGLIFGVIVVLGVGQVSLGSVTGLAVANADGNVPGLARLLFSRYVFAFEATSALLITAAIGAMVLAHRERLTPKLTQGDLAARRMRDYADHGLHPGPAAGRLPVGDLGLPHAPVARLGPHRQHRRGARADRHRRPRPRPRPPSRRRRPPARRGCR